MKLKLTMSNAETGEVLQEETNLDFAMMCFGRKTEEGMDFHGVTRAEQLDPFLMAKCLNSVDRTIEKNCNDNKAVGMAYALIKTGILDDGIAINAKNTTAKPGEASAAPKDGANKKEVEQA